MIDLVKRLVRRSLALRGKKLVPLDSVVVGPEWRGWRIFERDGVFSKHEPAFSRDPDFLSALEHIRSRELFPPHTSIELQPTYRLAIAWQLSRAAARVEGDMVEFGTFRGGTACAVLRATESIVPHKRLYLYDTFAGISEENLSDHERIMAGRYTDTSVEFVRETLGRYASRAEFKAGFIPSTLDETGPPRINFMHVDLNAAAATGHALEWAYPRWSHGGICLLDDYLWGGYEDQRQCLEVFFSGKQRQILGLPTGQGIVLNV
jgi:hypothetical protein